MSYSEHFLDGHQLTLPAIDGQEALRFEEEGLSSSEYFLDYSNYTVFQNPFRKFPYYTAANIDGNLFQKITRKELFDGKGDRWSKDKRIPGEHQLGRELYSAEKSEFDKGHLTKREDVQWGNEKEDAIEAAESTFSFTNAMPQVARLNRGVWRKIEDYILHHEVVQNSRKITLFTGPVFQEEDPAFVTEVKGETVKLPHLFWKVIYYNHNGTLHRTAFLTNQMNLLRKLGIVKRKMRSDGTPVVRDPFMSFKDAETYQVKVDFIESLLTFKFPEAAENFEDQRPAKLILKNTNVRSNRGEDEEEENPDIPNMTL